MQIMVVLCLTTDMIHFSELKGFHWIMVILTDLTTEACEVVGFRSSKLMNIAILIVVST